ncbi:hypothetical protein N7535_007322 [Penicillium sp. DV-2018c]|nr:hypothetical protein N7461_003349 [Penicillium sp. DV-2018c]KAJ5565684.1 hypothetical protein N7535_007322 [Penicillium sp. DV-2018c]
MIFDFKSIVLYGLMTLAVASPVPGLTKRAKLSDFQCPDGTVLSEHDIREAFHECRRHDDGSIGKYPFKFGNKSGGGKVFSNIPDGTDLREFPIVDGGIYTGGLPGKYRVVTDYKDNRGDFRGVMQHTGATVGGAYTACTRIDSKDKGKDKDDKKERSVEVTEGVDTEESTEHTPNDLATRSKKKKIGSATCPDGATFSKDDVGNAFSECKKNNDYGVGGYPHGFGNMSGNSQVFGGVTRDLREYPLLQGGTWTGGVPGKYRVVTDYNNKFVGVMIENAGASFQQCTVNSD